MKFLTLLFAFCLVVRVDAQVARAFVVAKSRSGQFTIREVAGHSRPRNLNPSKVPMAGSWAFALQPPPRVAAKTNLVELEPALLAIACERLKDALLMELETPDAWHGRVDLLINSAMQDGDEPLMMATLRPEGWNYQLEFPKAVKPDRLLRALVNVLLVEMANRNSNGEMAEVPLWLVEGMTAHLRAFNLPMFLVQERVTTLGNRVKLDALDVVHEHLRREQALTFEALSWPDSQQTEGRGASLYRDSAQLLVYELIHLKHGRADLRRMILQMPTHQNWQFTFLAAYHEHFRKLLDVEKWWALTCVSFAGNQITHKWTIEESRQKLQDLLDVPVEVHLSPDRMPAAAEITLQEVIQHWDRNAEATALDRTIAGLEMLAWHCAPELQKLVLSYHKTLQSYLHQRDHESHILKIGESSRVSSLKRSVCRDLDKLDAQRDGWHKQQMAKKN